MLPVSYRRIISEMQDIKWMMEKKQLESVEILEHQELKYAVFLISGPMDSPYEGYWFRIKLQWPENYPFLPPKCKLMDKIWNPYIDFQKKQLCIDILNTEYTPAMKTHHYILSIISLLSETKISEDQNFMNPEAAIQMMKNYPYFCEHARQICEKQSFKKKEIYSDNMRGVPEEHNIIVQGNLIPDLISENHSTNKFGKKTIDQKELKLQNPFPRRQHQLELENMTEQEIKSEIEKFRKSVIFNLQHYGMTRPPN